MRGLFSKLGTEIRSARVYAQDTVNRRLYIIFDSDGSQLAHPVYCLFTGPADGAAISMPELPRAGTQGLVLIPYGDTRNCVWIGSIYTGQGNAIPAPGITPFDNYFSHWNGAYEYMDKTGGRTTWAPDGSYVSFGQSNTLPSITRNVAVSGSFQKQTFNNVATRMASGVAAVSFGYSINMSSGSSLVFAASGAFTLAVAAGQTMTLQANNTTIKIDTSGNVVITLAGGATFQINGNSDALALVSKLISAFNIHTHGGVTNGMSLTAVPTTPWLASTVNSAYAKAGG